MVVIISLFAPAGYVLCNLGVHHSKLQLALYLLLSRWASSLLLTGVSGNRLISRYWIVLLLSMMSWISWVGRKGSPAGPPQDCPSPLKVIIVVFSWSILLSVLPAAWEFCPQCAMSTVVMVVLWAMPTNMAWAVFVAMGL